MDNSSFFFQSIHRIKTELYDLASYFLFEEGATGIEEIEFQEDSTIFRVFWEYSEEDEIKEIWQNLLENQSWTENTAVLLEVVKKEKENWQENWKVHFKPLTIGNAFYVIPPWEKPVEGKKNIIIQPGMGFGTGYHESTALALENLDWILQKEQPRSVADIGTGSGILLIASLLAGVEKSFAVDIDPESVAEVPGNLQLSGLDTEAAFLATGGPEKLKEPVDLVLANIIAEVLMEIRGDLERLMKPGAYLLLSGVFHELKEECCKAFDQNLVLKKEARQGDWFSLVYQKEVK